MIIQKINAYHRLMFFIGIGITASCVHLIVVYALVTALSLAPLIANIVAFLTAFNFSFIGHKHMTFAKLEDRTQLSLPHFFLVAASAGVLNESMYYLFLKYTTLNYLLALVLVLGIVAAYTFTLSRWWACRHI